MGSAATARATAAFRHRCAGAACAGVWLCACEGGALPSEKLDCLDASRLEPPEPEWLDAAAAAAASSFSFEGSRELGWSRAGEGGASLVREPRDGGSDASLPRSSATGSSVALERRDAATDAAAEGGTDTSEASVIFSSPSCPRGVFAPPPPRSSSCLAWRRCMSACCAGVGRFGACCQSDAAAAAAAGGGGGGGGGGGAEGSAGGEARSGAGGGGRASLPPPPAAGGGAGAARIDCSCGAEGLTDMPAVGTGRCSGGGDLRATASGCCTAPSPLPVAPGAASASASAPGLAPASAALASPESMWCVAASCCSLRWVPPCELRRAKTVALALALACSRLTMVCARFFAGSSVGRVARAFSPLGLALSLPTLSLPALSVDASRPALTGRRTIGRDTAMATAPGLVASSGEASKSFDIRREREREPTTDPARELLGDAITDSALDDLCDDLCEPSREIDERRLVPVREKDERRDELCEERVELAVDDPRDERFEAEASLRDAASTAHSRWTSASHRSPSLGASSDPSDSAAACCLACSLANSRAVAASSLGCRLASSCFA